MSDAAEIVARAARQSANYERRIEAQAEMLGRLLNARELGTEDRHLIGDIIEERNELRECNLLLEASVSAVWRLIDDTEEGTQQILTDLVRTALGDTKPVSGG